MTMAEARPRTLDPARLGPLEAWLARTLGADKVVIGEAALLAGGAVQENWRLAAEVQGGPRAGRHAWVLRTDAAARLGLSLDRATEFRCIEVAHAAGVAVAEPIACTDDQRVVGRPFMVQALAAGSAQARRIVRDPALASYGPALAARLGEEIAKVHAIHPPEPRLAALPRTRRAPVLAEVTALRAALDKGGIARPALEYVLNWLLENAPAPLPVSLLHGDFRTGNYMVDGGRLTALLDWEFCHWGDPREDLGWFCARCWRFGGDERQAGGIAAKADLVAGYNRVARHKVAEGDIAYWEVLAAARWAAIAALQGNRFLRDGERSLELALTGLMPAEMELDAMLGLEAIERGATRGTHA